MDQSTSKIKVAVIPAAGLATRFLPVAKTVPKGLIPIIDKPMIQYVVEEAVRSGINEIFFITSDEENLIEDYFKPNPALEDVLRQRGKSELADEVHAIGNLCRVKSV